MGLQSGGRMAGGAADPVRVIIGLLTVLFWVVFVVIYREKMLGDPDIWWHIRTGQWIWDQGAFPTTDPFSHTFAGRPWIAKEWLSQIVFFTGFSVAGWNGVSLISAAAMGLAAAALYKAMSDHLTPLFAASRDTGLPDARRLRIRCPASPAEPAAPHHLDVSAFRGLPHRTCAALRLAAGDLAVGQPARRIHHGLRDRILRLSRFPREERPCQEGHGLGSGSGSSSSPCW